jgi:hypothetical protein
MHGINNQHQQWYQRTYPQVSKLKYQSNIDIWWVSQGERIFIYLNYYLSQYHSKPYSYEDNFYLGMQVLAWDIDPNDNETKISLNTHTLLVFKNVKTSFHISEWYSKKMIPVQHC